MRAWVVLAEDPSGVGRLLEVVPELPVGIEVAGPYDAVLVVAGPTWSREAIRRYRATGGRAPVVLVAAGDTTPVAPYADDFVTRPSPTLPSKSVSDGSASPSERAAARGLDVDFARGTVDSRRRVEMGLTPTEVDLLRHLCGEGAADREPGRAPRGRLGVRADRGEPGGRSRRASTPAEDRSRPAEHPVPRDRARLRLPPRRHRTTGGREDGATFLDAPSPVETTTFVGRTQELEALAREVERGARVITLFGPAGVGKTRLARRFAASGIRRVGRSSSLDGGPWHGRMSSTPSPARCDCRPTRRRASHPRSPPKVACSSCSTTRSGSSSRSRSYSPRGCRSRPRRRSSSRRGDACAWTARSGSSSVPCRPPTAPRSSAIVLRRSVARSRSATL